MYSLLTIVSTALAVLVLKALLFRRISISSAAALYRRGGRIIDVRTPQEFAAVHVPEATNIPLDDILTVVRDTFPDRSTVLLLHCQGDRRSAVATRMLRRLGYRRVHDLGGLEAARLLSRRLAQE